MTKQIMADRPEFDKHDVYVFGYGSLMFGKGINGRGMQKVYTNSEVIPCEIDGYERGMYAHWESQKWDNMDSKDYTYYGIIKKPLARANGTIFKIENIFDLLQLHNSERCDFSGNSDGKGRYTFVDVTNLITMDDGSTFADNYPNAKCYTYVIAERHPNEDNGLRDRYEQYVDRGIRHLGPDFITRFHETSTNKTTD